MGGGAGGHGGRHGWRVQHRVGLASAMRQLGTLQNGVLTSSSAIPPSLAAAFRSAASRQPTRPRWMDLGSQTPQQRGISAQSSRPSQPQCAPERMGLSALCPCRSVRGSARRPPCCFPPPPLHQPCYAPSPHLVLLGAAEVLKRAAAAQRQPYDAAPALRRTVLTAEPPRRGRSARAAVGAPDVQR